MKLVHIERLVQAGAIDKEAFWSNAIQDVVISIKEVVWPPRNPAGEFVIFPELGKKRGKGNGVVPIKNAFLGSLHGKGWYTADRSNPERFDAVKYHDDNYISVEWETGNISSSHRSINRFILAHEKNRCQIGLLVLPTKNLAKYLTDRVGNFEELSHFFPVWRAMSRLWDKGAIWVFAVEHDREDTNSPRIAKGTNGRAIA
jgi:hypothetical protein